MGFFDLFRSKDKALDIADNVVDKGMDLLDKAFYTKEERAAAEFEVMETWLRIHESVAQQSHGTAVSRRLVVWAILSMVLMAFVPCLVLTIYGGFFVVPDEATALAASNTVSDVMELIEAFRLGWAFTAVVSFYLMAHIAGALKK